MMGLQFKPAMSEKGQQTLRGCFWDRQQVQRVQPRLGQLPPCWQGVAVGLSGGDLVQDAHTRYYLSRSTCYYPGSSH